MPLLSMSELTTFRWSFDEDVETYAAARYDGIGVWRQKLSDFGEELGINLLAENGLKVSSLSWAGGFTGSDGRTHHDSIDDGLDALRLAARMNADTLVVYTGSRSGHTNNHARRLVRTALCELSAAAEDFDVTLSVEPMHEGCADEWTFLHSLEETCELMDEVSSNRLALVFDVYHLAHDGRILDRLADIVPKIGIIQLADARQAPTGEQDRCQLGEGCLPLSELVAVFHDAGFNGFYEIELIGEEIELSDYNQLVHDSHQLFNELLTIPG